MELSKQVVGLPIAKRLKELGVKQKSLFYHTLDLELGVVGHDIYQACINEPDDEFFSAFTVAELGEMLPPGIKTAKQEGKNKWICWEGPIVGADTEADARGKMLIYLLEQGIINASEV